MTHICTTYSDDPQPGECTAPHHGVDIGYCYEHGEVHAPENNHDECEACENERNDGREYTEEGLIHDLTGMTGSLCDEHVREEMYEE